MATSGDLQLALLIKANAQQARAELAATQAQLKGVEASAKQAGSGFGAYNASLNDITAAQRTAAAAAGETTDALAGTSQAFTAAAAATAATGETAEQAAARIHAMVQASLAAQDAALGRNAAEAAAAKTARGTVDAAAAQSTAWRDLAAAQTASMQAYTTARAPVLELQAILQKSKLTTAEVARAEALLDETQASGIISAGELAEAFAALDAAKIVDTKTTQANTKANVENAASRAKGISSRTTYSLSALIDDAATGQFSRSKREVAALANETGLFAKLLTPTGLAIGGVVAALGLMAVAFAKGQAESAAFNRALVSTGTAGTTTAGQLVDMANQVGASTGRYGDAVTALTDLANTGKYTANQLQGLTQVAVDFATMTGGKVADGVKFVDAVMSGNIGTIQKLDAQYHFLTASQFDEIQRLIDQGQQEQATAIAQAAASKAVHDRAQEVQDNAGIMIRAWDGVKSAASAAWNAMKDVGATHSIGQQLKDAMADLQSAKGTHLDRAGNMVQNASPEAIAALNTKVNELRAQLVTQGFEQTQKAVQENADTKAKQGLADLAKFKTPLEAFQDATAKAKADLDKVMLGHLTADEIARAKMHYQQALDQAQKAYDSATKQHKGKSGGNIDHAQLNADVAAVQNQLRTLSNAWQNTQRVLDAQHRAGQLSDQQYFDTLKKDLDQYTQQRIAALEQEKTAASSHVKTAADRIRADQKVQQIDAEISQTRADQEAKRAQINAQEKKSVEDLTKAWEKLQAEVGKGTGSVDFGAFDQKVATAKAALGAGLTDQQGYQSTIDKLVMQTVQGGGAPQYRGLSARVGGAFADYGRAQNAEGAENAYFQQELNRLVAFFNQKKITSEKYYADLENLAQAHNQRLQQIDAAKNLAMVTGITTSFDQAAQAVGAAFGQQSTAYRIAFDIAKSAAIAQATVAMFQAIAEASKMPWPANIGLMAEAFAQGMSIVADIRAIQLGPSGGFAEGGYTGAGGVQQPAGIVHAGEVVYSQRDVARHGGVAAVEAHRLRGFAEGGYVSPLANAPSPAELGFTAPSQPRMDISKLAAANDARASAPGVGVRIVNSIDPGFVTGAMNSAEGETVIMNVLSKNSVKLKQMVR